MLALFLILPFISKNTLSIDMNSTTQIQVDNLPIKSTGYLTRTINGLELITLILAPAPPKIMKLIICKCTKTCVRNCSCVKEGLKCSVVHILRAPFLQQRTELRRRLGGRCILRYGPVYSAFPSSPTGSLRSPSTISLNKNHSLLFLYRSYI